MVLVFLSIIMVFCSSYLVGINAQFLAMANLLFNNVATSVDLNRSSMVLFITQRSLWRGCSVTPYLFIIMTEVFNMMVYKGIIGKKLAKIVLFNFKKQKILPNKHMTSISPSKMKNNIWVRVYNFFQIIHTLGKNILTLNIFH